MIKHCFQAFISSHPFSPLLLFHRDSRANKSKMWQRAFILLSYLPLSSMPRILHLPFFPPLNNRSKQHPRPPIPPILPEIMVVGAKRKKMTRQSHVEASRLGLRLRFVNRVTGLRKRRPEVSRRWNCTRVQAAIFERWNWLSRYSRVFARNVATGEAASTTTTTTTTTTSLTHGRVPYLGRSVVHWMRDSTTRIHHPSHDGG